MAMMIHDNFVDDIESGNNDKNIDHLMMIIILELQFFH
jgi:hypothetical protein